MPPLALLAGGLATRLLRLTANRPKSLIEVAGAPFISHQLRLLRREGVTDVVICTGHFGDQIEACIGDGSKYGCHVKYSSDGAVRRGTGGAVRRALPLLGKEFFVMYGDSYLEVDFRRVYKCFRESRSPALMTVFRNEGRWDTSNVEFANRTICSYDKITPTPAMRHIDYGLALLRAEAVQTFSADIVFDLADLYRYLVARKLVAGCEVTRRFYEIGSPAGLAETDAYLRNLAD
jgi:NDP-sugar pyrophosphorylase family protein